VLENGLMLSDNSVFYLFIYLFIRAGDSVATMTGTAEESCFESRQGHEIYYFTRVFRRGVGFAELSIECVPGDFTPPAPRGG
jgi:hypothetical protein